ncbi:DUF4350 domain-containing protein [Tenacibaculum jejuense]|uniref:DUF4350 domain-containing protein n=1 Tax=Tenacibaculum jejuense TaxID=584609 RepID=A0A238UC17_9FLAO|nr:DUF4350 domain-containing protein [Tenacibaculum jejuense]SNR15960.1 Probable transmembrane protein of unknown function [Tenacibaculum jejuense]
MRKSNRFYIIGVLLFTIVGCKKTNWRENYQERSKDPFGTYIFANELENLFNDNEFEVLDEHIYDYLLINPVTTKDQGNYVCVKSYAYQLDKKTIKKLLDFVAVGNTVFLASNSFSSILQKELSFETKNLDDIVYSIEDLKQLDATLYLNNNQLSPKKTYFDRNLRRNYFESIDSTKTTVLGTQNINSERDKANFIKIRHGEGHVFLHTQPIVFTNYYLLKDNASYVENVFSYLPDRPIFLDTQTKRSKYKKNKEQKSALNFFYKHPSLKWALHVAFFGLLLFLFLNARRKQRAIPELKALKNSTQDFTHTIANLYLKEDNHKNLVTKKITYFLEKVRTKYHLDTQNLNASFIEKLAAKSGNTEHTTKYLINTITTINKRSQCSQEELVQLNSLIENFLKNK